MIFLALLFVSLALPGKFTGSLAGAALDTPVLNQLRTLGVPSLVQSTDDGQEWRWFNARGIDVDVLTDDQLTVRQILVSRPESIEGKTWPLVQPAELPLLELPLSDVDKALATAGAQRQPEPERAISAWHFGNDYVILELEKAKVEKILALDAWAAQHFGYAGTGPLLTAHRAPRLVHQPAVDYPHRAIANHAEGVVIIRVDVASTGAVKNTQVLVSSGNTDIDAAELESMRRATFRPARCDGQACDGVFLDREEYFLSF